MRGLTKHEETILLSNLHEDITDVTFDGHRELRWMLVHRGLLTAKPLVLDGREGVVFATTLLGRLALRVCTRTTP